MMLFVLDASTFTGFFNYPTMRALLDNFCVYHVTAPGQEEGAPTFPEELVVCMTIVAIAIYLHKSQILATLIQEWMSFRPNCCLSCLTLA